MMRHDMKRMPCRPAAAAGHRRARALAADRKAQSVHAARLPVHHSSLQALQRPWPERLLHPRAVHGRAAARRLLPSRLQVHVRPHLPASPLKVFQVAPSLQADADPLSTILLLKHLPTSAGSSTAATTARRPRRPPTTSRTPASPRRRRPLPQHPLPLSMARGATCCRPPTPQPQTPPGPPTMPLAMPPLPATGCPTMATAVSALSPAAGSYTCCCCCCLPRSAPWQHPCLPQLAAAP